jgi:hypothetical protein
MEETIQFIEFADGTRAAILRSMDYGDATIIILLIAILSIMIYQVWRDAKR